MKHTATVLSILMAFCLVVAVQAREPDPPERYTMHTVQAGETLWGIAERYLPDVDPRLGVHWVTKANSLNTAIIHPGDILKVPVTAIPADTAQPAVQDRPEPLQAAARGTRARVLTVEATAYCACEQCTGKQPGHPAYGITASGEPVQPGTVAVDPEVIPLGTKLWVQGYGPAMARDTGGAIKGQRIDVYFPTHQEALEWGRRQVRIKIIQEEGQL